MYSMSKKNPNEGFNYHYNTEKLHKLYTFRNDLIKITQIKCQKLCQKVWKCAFESVTIQKMKVGQFLICRQLFMTKYAIPNYKEHYTK